MAMTSSRWALPVASVLALITATTAYAVTVSSKFPIAAAAQMSVGAAFDGTNFLVALQGDATDQHNVGAQLVSQSGTRVGPLISTGHTTGGAPAVAFDGTNYLLLWADDATNPQDRVYGQLISPSGILVGAPFAIGPASGGQYGILAATFGGTNYLVVWEDRRNDTNGNNQCDPGEGTCMDIWGQFVTPSGALHGSAIPISIEEDNQRGPAVAFDGTRYLVAWNNRQHDLWDVNGRFITEDGILSYPFVTSQTSSPSQNSVSIAFDGHDYLVVWNKDIGLGYPNPIIWDVYGRVVSPSGALLVSEFPISAAPGTHPFPWVAFDGTNYLVTWTDLRNDTNGNLSCDPGEGTCWDIYAQFVSPIGSLVGSEFPINADPGDQGISPVVFGAGKYLVAWGDRGISGGAPGDVYGAFVSPLSACVGDCSTDGQVTVNEIITMVNIALGSADVSICLAGDANNDGQITVDEILKAVNYALSGCPAR
jgi:hypothetical protein